MVVNHLHLLLLQIIILLLWTIKFKASEASCPTSCGKVKISDPFGIGKGCFVNEWFEITCDTSSPGPAQPFLRKMKLKLAEDTAAMSFGIGVEMPAISLKSTSEGINLTGSPFFLTNKHNSFIATGCKNYAKISETDESDSTTGGCLTIGACDPLKTEDCYDFICPIPSNTTFDYEIESKVYLNMSLECKSAFIVDKNWVMKNYINNPFVLRESESLKAAPAILEYGTGQCTPPSCKFSHNGDDKHMSDPPEPKSSGNGRKKNIIIGLFSGFGTLSLYIGARRLYEFVRRRIANKLKQKFFKKNGGSLLGQRMSSNRGNIQKLKFFTEYELEKATDSYSEDRKLGQGGQGTVYKGMLKGGRIIAVKRLKKVAERVDVFIKEVEILSRINHRNVVQFLGCCLDTEFLLLVYEFIPNGTLFQYIHDQNEEFPLTWDLRLRIAIEVADALHSAASVGIYHRDIKSSDVLLDEKYQAKVSDFGTSRSIPVDQTNLTTQELGTYGYLDPEYRGSSQFTEKTGVYSFGVVLAELLTGEKPVRSTNSEEEDQSLALYFLQIMEENRLFEILDARISMDGIEQEIKAFADLTRRCLELNWRKRPRMREVATELAGIRASYGVSILKQKFEETEVAGDINNQPGTSSSFTESFFD